MKLSSEELQVRKENRNIDFTNAGSIRMLKWLFVWGLLWNIPVIFADGIFYYIFAACLMSIFAYPFFMAMLLVIDYFTYYRHLKGNKDEVV